MTAKRALTLIVVAVALLGAYHIIVQHGGKLS